MKRIWLGTFLAIFVLTMSVGVASAATGSGLGSTAATVYTFNMGPSLQAAGHSATLLTAASYQSNRAEKERDDFKGKDKGRGNDDKDKFHGAEMSSSAIVIAGLLAISAYFLFVRRKSHTRA